ncbi:phenylalanine--tRNA ligase subunit alpha [Candidatus Gracilibacteria bacterium]|nr:phenylalanine--tRNA ligase subunit alpha [Candidatus Gracilibacteria bacterium]
MLETAKILKEIDGAKNLKELEIVFDKYLGKKGLLNEEFKKMATLSIEEKKEYGKILSDAKLTLTETYESKEQILSIDSINEKLREDIVDISLEGKKVEQGSESLVTKARRDAEEIFKSMGFFVEYGHDMVTKYENFVAVNIPLTHPATEMHDTIYVTEKDSGGDNLVMRTHTSSMQNYMIKKYGVPLKIIVPGRCYRFDEMDSSHDTAFWQVEGMVIDENISIGVFKSIMSKFVSAVFKDKIELRIRPGFFPFVEPGFEIDAACPICKGKGCGLCKNSGRIEIIPAGMIHPNVLKEAGVDTNKYSGFAFGMGLTRIAAIKYGIKDIRYFTNGDLRFAKSFK